MVITDSDLCAREVMRSSVDQDILHNRDDTLSDRRSQYNLGSLPVGLRERVRAQRACLKRAFFVTQTVPIPIMSGVGAQVESG